MQKPVDLIRNAGMEGRGRGAEAGKQFNYKPAAWGMVGHRSIPLGVMVFVKMSSETADG